MKTRFAPAPLLAALLLCSNTAFAGDVAASSLDHQVRAGVTELARVDWTAHAEGARTVAAMNYANLHTLVRQGISELARADWSSELNRSRLAADARFELAQMGRYGITEFLREDLAEVRVAAR